MQLFHEKPLDRSPETHLLYHAIAYWKENTGIYQKKGQVYNIKQLAYAEQKRQACIILTEKAKEFSKNGNKTQLSNCNSLIDEIRRSDNRYSLNVTLDRSHVYFNNQDLLKNMPKELKLDPEAVIINYITKEAKEGKLRSPKKG